MPRYNGLAHVEPAPTLLAKPLKECCDGGSGDGRGYAVPEMIAVIERISGCDFEVRPYPRRPGDQARIVAEASRIRTRPGWQPRHDDRDTWALAWEDKLSMRKRV